MEVLRGTVKNFSKYNYGFVCPDEARMSDVFIHQEYFSGPEEDVIGELSLNFARLLEKPPNFTIPRYGDVIVYVPVYRHYKGAKRPTALHWTFASEWDRALAIINARPDPTDRLIRMYRFGTQEQMFRPTLLWEGHDSEYLLKLDAGLPEVGDESCYFEELKATGWQRAWHPSEWHEKYKPQE